MRTSEIIDQAKQLTSSTRLNIYENKSQWKIGLFAAGLLIVIVTLLYNNRLATKLAEQERRRVETFANAYAELSKLPFSDNSSTLQIDFLTNIITGNLTIPVILTDEKGRITATKNVDSTRTIKTDSAFFYRKLAKMKEQYEPVLIVSDLSGVREPGETEPKDIIQYVYYSDSYLLAQLKLYPYVQIFIIGAFLLAAYVTFDVARRSEQNKVWLGMAKETAHQLGTPLSSLVGWMEILKETDDPDGTAKMVGREMEKDIARLQLITERFSKIGSEPALQAADVVESVKHTVDYVKRRASSRINFEFTAPPQILSNVNPTLFDWVIENLLKNALDAMENTGSIKVTIEETPPDNIVIDISDTGKGIPKSKFSSVFEPGYSTKRRGWGLGLSLSKRIIENYHSGKIYVLDSVVGKGTTFRIILPKS